MFIPLNEIQKDALIQLFAENKIEKIDCQPETITLIFIGIEGVNSFVDIEKTISDYKLFTIHLRAIKKNIEEIIKLPTVHAQVRYCLIQLSNIVEGNDQVKIDIFSKIVDRMFLSGLWIGSADLVKKYKDISTVIQKWNHFFVSYTTKDIPAVNNLYGQELFCQFNPGIVEKEITKNNLIAKFIVKCLKNYNGLKVFFDRESIVCGDIIQNEVYQYCEKTFAFIQLIEDISFNMENGVANWCYNEYQHFQHNNPNGKKRRHFFLIDGLDIRPNAVPQSYFNWAQDIIETNYERIHRPLDVILVKKKCQDFAISIREARIAYINELIKAVA